MTDKKYTLFFDQATEEDYNILGGKGASLAKMTAEKLPVPFGFSVTTTAYHDALLASGVYEDIVNRISSVDVKDLDALKKEADAIREEIEEIHLPEGMEATIRDNYRKLCALTATNNDLPVAVRSSANAEDLPDASFAGQQDTFLWVIGEDEVVHHIKKCWASLYTRRAISYRADQNISESDVLMSVVVQKMVNAKCAGVAMTLNPLNGDRSKIVIDAAWGLGEAVVSGEITPDNFLMDKVILEMVSSTIASKPFELIADANAKAVVKHDITCDRADEASLTQAELKSLCQLAKKLEKLHGCPQDIEWAIDNDMPEGSNIALLQSRPETVWSNKKKEEKGKPKYQFGIEGVVGTLLNPLQSKK